MSNLVLNNHRQFAAILMIKERCKNGILDTSKPHYILAKEIGMSQSAFKKYFKQGVALGIIRPKSYYHRTIKLRTICAKLGIVGKNRKFKSYLNKKDISKMNLSKLSTWVHDCLVRWDLEQQNNIIEKKKQLISVAKRLLANCVKSGEAKLMINKAKKLGFKSVTDYCVSLVSKENSNIVTGCIHLASKIGLSYQSANRSLNRLHSEGFINRKIVVKVYDCVFNHSAFDGLKIAYPKRNIFVHRDTFISYIGSLITLPQ